MIECFSACLFCEITNIHLLQVHIMFLNIDRENSWNYLISLHLFSSTKWLTCSPLPNHFKISTYGRKYGVKGSHERNMNLSFYSGVWSFACSLSIVNSIWYNMPIVSLIKQQEINFNVDKARLLNDPTVITKDVYSISIWALEHLQ